MGQERFAYFCAVCTDRGHVTLLGDLNAVGRALESLVRGRGKGIGLGVEG